MNRRRVLTGLGLAVGGTLLEPNAAGAAASGAPTVYDVRDYGARGDGRNDDTRGIAAAIAACPAGGTVYFPEGDYLTAPIAVDKRIRILGAGPEKTTLFAQSGATDPLLGLVFSSYTTAAEVRDLGFNLTAAPGTDGLVIHNGERALLANLKFRRGRIGLRIGHMSATLAFDIHCLNQTRAGVYVGDPGGALPNVVLQHVFVGVSDAQTTMTAGVEIEGACAGVTLDDVQVLAPTSGSTGIAAGIRAHVATQPTGAAGQFLFLTSCQVDGVLGPALELVNARGVWATNNFLSSRFRGGFPGISIVGGREMQFANNWISGSGVQFAGAPDRLLFVGNVLPQTSPGGAFQLPPAGRPTNLTLAANQAYASLTNDPAALAAAAPGATGNDVAGAQPGGSPAILQGKGSPQGRVAAPVGSLYLRSDGKPGKTLYVKEAGAGKRGWAAK